MKLHIIFSLFLFSLIQIAFASPKHTGRCGMVRFLELKEKPFSNQSSQPLSRITQTYSTKSTCKSGSFSDSVQVRLSSHFRIYYNTRGVHRILSGSSSDVNAFLDTTESVLERAWTFYADSMKMNPPVGSNQTLIWNRSDHSELFPIEIADLGSWNSSYEGGYYGLTLPGNKGESQIIIENDFLAKLNSSGKDSTIYETQSNGDTLCGFVQTQQALTGYNGESYREHWETALQVTLAHELYHTFQLGYLDFRDRFNFWFEASATGMENIHYPKIDDYLQYLPSVFNYPQTPLTDSSMSSNHMYGESIFLHFLFSIHPATIDQKIWSRLNSQYSESIAQTFQHVLNDYYQENLDSLFHLFALQQFFSDSNASYSPLWSVSEDSPKWPELAKQSLPSEGILQKTLDPLSFSAIELSDFQDQDTLSLADENTMNPPIYASIILTSNSKKPVRIQEFTTPFVTQDFNKAYLLVSNGSFSKNTQFSIESSLGKNHILYIDSIPQEKNSKSHQAYPNPFRPNIHSQICFKNSENTVIRIYNAAGNPIIKLFNSNSEPLCWNGRSLSGIKVSAGIYPYVIQGSSKVHRIIILR